MNARSAPRDQKVKGSIAGWDAVNKKATIKCCKTSQKSNKPVASRKSMKKSAIKVNYLQIYKKVK